MIATVDEIEAVQFREWSPWHAVLACGDRTVCGRNAINAEQMYEDWIDQEFRCVRCLQGLRRPGVIVGENGGDCYGLHFQRQSDKFSAERFACRLCRARGTHTISVKPGEVADAT